MSASLTHVALSALPFAVGYGAALAGPQWAAALSVGLYWLGRELAQSMRPSAPLSFDWTMTNTLNFALPTVAAIAAAVAITVLR